MSSNNEPWSVFTYPLSKYPFTRLVAAALEVDNLTAIKTDGPRWTRETDQSSAWHWRFYESFSNWQEVYHQFVREQIAPRINEPVYYQNVPTFRVHQPDNVSVGEFHTDRQYHHPDGEITFWLPLTEAYDTNSVWVADDDGTLRPFVVVPGEVVMFLAITRLHGNLINTTGQTRVSFDFRCLPVSRLPAEPARRSINTGLQFIPGAYYHAEPIGTPTG